MPLVEAVRMALTTLWTQKLKSFFSLLGVLIGVTFLIAVVSIVQGMNVYMEDEFANRLVGLNTFQVRRMPNFNMGNITDEMWREWLRRPRINYGDASFIQAKLETPAVFSRSCDDRTQIVANGKSARDIRVEVVDPGYFTIKNYDFSAGRPFTPQEARAGLPVAVIGADVEEKMFPGIDPIGKSIAIGGLPYRVIGVVAKQGTLFGLSLDAFIVAPFDSPLKRIACRLGYMDEFHVQAPTVAQMNEAVAQTEGLMRIRRQLRPAQDNNFAIQTAEGALSGWKKISAVLFAALPGLVAISLVVGGIVIMNIMLMAVSERTREIGIRKALGAKRRDILAQFVIESATISTVGAAIGIVLGILLAFIVKATTPLPAAVAPWSIGVGVFLGIFVGMVAGVYPASRASKLDPITALRAE
ncbi:MAG: ABC transporter permease [Gemmatimonadales bacterium]|nr:ABC transporter permease [Gemmatimonadota bacterium]MDX2057936.1 ABC transporter permease [Gemmatimonadales bacterium]